MPKGGPRGPPFVVHYPARAVSSRQRIVILVVGRRRPRRRLRRSRAAPDDDDGDDGSDPGRRRRRSRSRPTTPAARSAPATETAAETPAAAARRDDPHRRRRPGRRAARRSKFESGDTIRLRFASDDADGGPHPRLRQRRARSPAGGERRVRFKADAEGIFEIEEHGTGELLAKLESVRAEALDAVDVRCAPGARHGIVGREDLPIPRWLFGWAATVVLVVSFVALAVAVAASRGSSDARERRVLRVPRVARGPAAALLGVALLRRRRLGRASPARSRRRRTSRRPSSTSLFWVGVPVLSLLLRRRLPRVQPVAGDRPRRRLGRRARRRRPPARAAARTPSGSAAGPRSPALFAFALGRARLRRSATTRARSRSSRSSTRRSSSSAWRSTASRRGRAAATASPSTSGCFARCRRCTGATRTLFVRRAAVRR